MVSFYHVAPVVEMIESILFSFLTLRSAGPHDPIESRFFHFAIKKHVSFFLCVCLSSQEKKGLDRGKKEKSILTSLFTLASVVCPQ